MATLYTNGDYIFLTPAQFAAYSLIRYSADEPTREVELALSASGTINFATRLGTVSALIDGWTGNDNITSGSGNDSLWGNAGNDTLTGGLGDDFLVGDWDDGVAAGNDGLYGGDGNDTLVAGLGNDGLYGGNGDDVMVLADSLIGAVTFSGGAGMDVALLSDGFEWGLDTITVTRLVLNSAASIDFFDAQSIRLIGTAGNDLIDLSGTLAFRWGNYFQTEFAIDLRDGNDTFIGGASNEIVSIVAGGDQIAMGDGDDLLSIVGGSMAGVALSGGAGYDRLYLGDTLLVTDGSPATLAVTSFAFLTSGLFEEVEVAPTLQLTGTEAADTLSMVGVPEFFLWKPIALLGGNDRFTAAFGIAVDGGAGNDTLIGSAGSDDLDGGTGNDSMSGGLSDDRYHVDSVQDVIVELANQGDDTVVTSLASFALGANFERLAAEGDGGLFGTGTAGNNRMNGAGGRDRFLGLDGADELDGGDGIDTLEGGLGDDIYYGRAGDLILEVAGAGNDRVIALETRWTLQDNIEVLTTEIQGDFLGTGNGLANLIFGRSGNDSLRGLEGNDSLFGSGGNDVLDGGAGDDDLSGSIGDDLYFLDRAGDRIIEEVGEGNDTVIVSFSVYTLRADLENLVADRSVSAVDFKGNSGNNRIEGSVGDDLLMGAEGDDTLDGGTGLDRLNGGSGNDLYLLGRSDRPDRIIEAPDSGIDTVFTLADTVSLTRNLENLTLGTALGASARGNELDNSITGGTGNDTIDGRNGNDMLDGGMGDDALRGAAGNDTLVGGEGADTLTGGDGDDTYILSDGPDTIVEAASGGRDRIVVTSNGAVSMVNIEELVIGTDIGLIVTGAGNNIAVTGAAGSDTLDGWTGNDTLDGGGGFDHLSGGMGDDVYVVTFTGTSALNTVLSDAVTEQINAGTDTLRVSAAIAILDIANVEVLHNTYRGATSASKGSLNLGSDGNDLIITDLSQDTLDGGQGSDTLTGGLGADSFLFRTKEKGSFDTITDFNVREDRIGLDSGVFVGGFGTLNPNAFRDITNGGFSFVDSDDRILYQRTFRQEADGHYTYYGILYFDPDGGGREKARVIAEILGAPVLTNAHFFVDSFTNLP